MRHHLRRFVNWCPPVVGGLFLLVVAATLASPDESFLVDLFDVSLPLVAGLVLVGLTPTFRRLDIDPEYKPEILWTALVVGFLMAGALLWEDLLLAMDGFSVPFEKRIQAVINGLALGLLVGGAAGYYRARAKQEIQDVADARHDFQEIFEKAAVGIALIDPEAGTVERTNQHYADILGYDPETLVGRSIEDISGDGADFDQKTTQQLIERAMAGEPQQFDWVLDHSDGTSLWVDVSIKRATVGGEERLLAFINDASERKARQQQLEAHAIELEKFREIFEHADEAIGLTDPDSGRIIEANPKYAEILGYEDEGLERMTMSDITADSEDFTEAEIENVIETVMRGAPQSLDWQLERKDGSTVWVSVTLQRATIGSEDRLLVFFREVTERKQREEEIERHRNEMEFFNSLLRHDVLNGITVIRTHGSRLAKSLDGDEREHAETVVEWADNVTGVVDRVRDVLETLTGNDEKTFHPVNLSENLQAESDRLAGAYPDVTVEADVPPDVHVEADDLLGDVFRNVLTNAVDHNGTEDLTITSTVEQGPETAMVRISDTGSGIAGGDKEAAFRRGQTGHVKKTGSGFGLFFVDSMVSAYGGDVWVEDNEPTGAVFVIELPAVAE